METSPLPVKGFKSGLISLPLSSGDEIITPTVTRDICFYDQLYEGLLSSSGAVTIPNNRACRDRESNRDLPHARRTLDHPCGRYAALNDGGTTPFTIRLSSACFLAVLSL